MFGFDAGDPRDGRRMLIERDKRVRRWRWAIDTTSSAVTAGDGERSGVFPSPDPELLSLECSPSKCRIASRRTEGGGDGADDVR